MFKIRFLLHAIGGILSLNAFLMLFSVFVSVIYGETETIFAFLKAMVIVLALGLPLLLIFHRYDKNIGRKEGYLLVVLSWGALTFSGALPFIFLEVTSSFTDAFFESISGYTTTGATIFNDVEALPKGILFWRSLTHWIGGMGIIVLAVTFLPLLGIGSVQLFSAEAPGIKTDKIHPRIQQTAKVLWGLYLGYTLLETILLYWAGMSFFDAINHAFSTIATGGFSTKNASVAYWNNAPIIQYILILFMFLAGSNFILTYFLLTGKFQKVIKDDEFRAYAFFILLTSIIVTISLYGFSALPKSITEADFWSGLEVSFRHSLLQVVSIVTTTGFISSDYTSWNNFLVVISFVLLFTGACAGSTSGGIKIVRHLLMLRNSALEFKRALHPSAIIPTRLNGRAVSRNLMYSVLGFFILYMILVLLGTMALGLLGNDFETALSGAAATLGNVGPGLGEINPMKTYQSLCTGSKWVCTFLMFVGRLELVTPLMLLTPYFWKKI